MSCVSGCARRTGRLIMVILLSVFWLVARCFWSPSIVFVVYGNSRTHSSYAPKWLEQLVRFIGLMPVMSLIRCGDQRGIVVGLLDPIETIEADLSSALKLQDDLVRRFPRSTIALAGRLPSILHRAGGIIKPPIVGGYTGTCYAMRCIALALAEQYGETYGEDSASDRTTCSDNGNGDSSEDSSSSSEVAPSTLGKPCDTSAPSSESNKDSSGARNAASLTVAVIGGAGFVGARLVKDFSNYFRKVIAFDLRYKNPEAEAHVLQTSNPESLGEAQVSLIFTPNGDDVAPVVPYLTAGSIVADDTHPCVSAPVRAKFDAAKVTLLKAAAVNDLKPVSFYPKLPNFKRNSIPGCLLEALVVSRCGHEIVEDFEKFCQEAEALGFGPQLMTDLEEPLVDSLKSHRSLSSLSEKADTKPKISSPEELV
eukprot:TRINITY_DN846_c0_g1_i2.p1 TRINITY_DN846_c0_g1~~TRINITY_DN846_c0_g1_i2.p1  ORF type:complete len:424 (+),score=63.87 TRINITY_DN846_c0_g1_i2:82-1353(+)